MSLLPGKTWESREKVKKTENFWKNPSGDPSGKPYFSFRKPSGTAVFWMFKNTWLSQENVPPNSYVNSITFLRYGVNSEPHMYISIYTCTLYTSQTCIYTYIYMCIYKREGERERDMYINIYIYIIYTLYHMIYMYIQRSCVYQHGPDHIHAQDGNALHEVKQSAVEPG